MPKIKVKASTGITPEDDLSVQNLNFICQYFNDGASTPTTPFPSGIIMGVIIGASSMKPVNIIPDGQAKSTGSVTMTGSFTVGASLSYVFFDGVTQDPTSTSVIPSPSKDEVEDEEELEDY